MSKTISEEKKTISYVNLNGEFDSIRYNHCIFTTDVFINATVENEVEFIECTLENNSCLFLEGGEYKKEFTLSFAKVNEININGGKFANFHLGYWGNSSSIGKIHIDKLSEIEGKLQFSRISGDELSIRGQNEKAQLIFEECQFNLINIFQFINKASVRFQNIEALNSSNPEQISEFNVLNSNLGATDFFYVDFDSFNNVNFRNSFLANCIFVVIKMRKRIGAKIGRGFHNGEISMLEQNIQNEENSQKQFEESEYKRIFGFDKNEGRNNILNYKSRIKVLQAEDNIKQIAYRKENYKQLKYSFYKSNDRINEKIFHGLEMEEFMKMDIPKWDKFILRFSKWSSDFGQSFLRPIIFNGCIHILLCLIVFGILKYEGYYFSIKNHSWSVFFNLLNECLYLFVPLKSFNKDILLIDILMKINSGFFIYNILRAIRKYYH